MSDENLRKATADELLTAIKSAADGERMPSKLEALARAYSLVVEGMPKGSPKGSKEPRAAFV